MDWPPPADPPPERLIRVARLADLAEGRPRRVRVGVKQLMVVKLGERVFVTNSRCPHAGGSLVLGRLCGGQIVCPRHQWAFDLASGACPEHDVYRLTTYRVELHGGEVFAAVPVSTW